MAAELATSVLAIPFCRMWRRFNESDARTDDRALLGRLARSGARFFLASAESELSAFASYLVVPSLLHDRPSAELTSLYVAPEYRRRRIAADLIEVLKADAQLMGCEGVHASAATSAVGFYAKQGFRQYAQRMRLALVSRAEVESRWPS